jgi:putative Holliday junction resolvase
MALFNMSGLPAELAPGARLIGIDPGARRIGLALSDVGRAIASPYGSLRRARLRQNAAEIAAIASREGAGGLIVGLPLDAEGNFGPAAQAARDWALALSEAVSLPASLWDERYSTADVTRVLVEQVDLGRKRRAAIIDRMAAAFILQAALDALRQAQGVAAPCVST